MDNSQFDVLEVFDPLNYLYFYETMLTDERTDREADLIWRLLDLRAGMEVLDLACGYGRIANRLAARGCAMVGLDVTPAYLDLARQAAAAQGLTVEYVEGDMRSLPWQGRFDRVVNWFTAFGYFEDDGNRAVLAAAYRGLQSGGRLLIDVLSRDYLLKHYQNHSVMERDGNFLIDRMHFDPITGRNHTERTIVRDGKARVMRFFIRFLTFPEIADWLRQAGFRKVTGYDQNGGEFGADSRRMIVVAEK